MGLTDNEVKIYLALLSAGTAPASAISKRTDIVKSTVHFTCQNLVKQGLVRSIQRGNVTLFTCRPPSTLLDLVDRRRRDLDYQEKGLKTVIEDLNALCADHASAPTVNYYEGIAALTESYQQIIDEAGAGEEMLCLLHPIDSKAESRTAASITQELDSFFERCAKQRVQKSIRLRILAAPSRQAEEDSLEDEGMLRQTRISDRLTYAGGAIDITIAHDTLYVVVVEQDVIFGYSVKNPSVVAMHRTMFEILWETLGPAR